MQNGHDDTILDLRGLAEPDLLVIDRSSGEWPIPASVPLRTALELLTLSQEAQNGRPELETSIDSLLAVFRLRRPACTREDVLDAFSLAETRRLVEWVFFRLAGQAQSNGTEPQPAQPHNRQERRAATRKPSSSPPASDVAS